MLFLFQSHNPELVELPSNFKFKTIDDYKTLFNFDIAKSEKFSELFQNSSEKDKYITFAQLIKSVNNIIHKKVAKLKSDQVIHTLGICPIKFKCFATS